MARNDVAAFVAAGGFPKRHFGWNNSGRQVRGNDADEVALSDDFRRPPIGREVPDIAGDEVIGSGGFGTLKELVVVRIGCGPNDASWCYDVALAG